MEGARDSRSPGGNRSPRRSGLGQNLRRGCIGRQRGPLLFPAGEWFGAFHLPDVVAPLTGQKAVAALGAVTSLTLGRGLVAKIPGGNIGLAVGGAVIAIAGAKMLDGHVEAFVVGFGVGAAAQGLIGMFLGGKGA